MNSLIDAVQLVMRKFKEGGYSEVQNALDTIPYSRNEIKSILEAFLALEPDDPERQIVQKILERSGKVLPREGQQTLDDL